MNSRIDRISFFGLGYVGLVSAACLASKGFEVVGFDVDRKRLRELMNGNAPIYEPGLEELIKEGVASKRLRFTADYKDAVLSSDLTFITVGTPSRQDGSIDLTYVRSASRMIGDALRGKDGWHLVVVKSTVTPGTTGGIVRREIERASDKRCGHDFGLCMNPEFLREGSAVRDALEPDRVVIGEFDKRSGDALEGLYREFYGEEMKLVRTSLVNAELIKYASNAFLAMKVSFINMIANLCQRIPGADVEVVAKGIGLDRRIGPDFLKAGLGWGGSCWPKDLKALKDEFERLGVDSPLIDATLKVNDVQPYRILELARGLLGSLDGKRVALLGLSFKPNTDDMRGAVSIRLVNALLDEGASVVVYDPKAMGNAKLIFGDRVDYAKSAIDCIKGSDCVVIVTGWDEFRGLKPDDFKRYMRDPVVVDGRRIFDPKEFEGIKFASIGLGRAELASEDRGA